MPGEQAPTGSSRPFGSLSGGHIEAPFPYAPSPRAPRPQGPTDRSSCLPSSIGRGEGRRVSKLPAPACYNVPSMEEAGHQRNPK